MYGGGGISNVLTVSCEFLLSFQNLWRQRGDDILDGVTKFRPHRGVLLYEASYPIGASRVPVMITIVNQYECWVLFLLCAAAKLFTRDGVRRISPGVAKLPELARKVLAPKWQSSLVQFMED